MAFTKKEKAEFRKRATAYVLEEFQHLRHDYRSEIGRWMNALKLECTKKIEAGEIDGEKFYLDEKASEKYLASFGPSPLMLAMAAIFGDHAGKKTPMGKVLDATYPHQVKRWKKGNRPCPRKGCPRWKPTGKRTPSACHRARSTGSS